MSSPELAHVVREHPRVHGVESEISRLEPNSERAEVCAICALRCRGEATMLEEAFDRCSGVHTAWIRRRSEAAFHPQRITISK